ncbi:hypothetical protein F2Q69_00005228 [Brassica cretica]|uniref:Uncharacterized protein n=1 Tax=Brassica cretica TaxID=69181 RepID=A0A8S9NQN0_BRACR|nr:hypothetical protein F2Q69_00005228 [Brassica cretica]
MRRHALLQYASLICFGTLIVFLTQIRALSLSLLKLALSRRDQVNQAFSFFPVRDPTKQAARPRPDSKNDQLAASISLWWSKSTLHKFLKVLISLVEREGEVSEERRGERKGCVL